MKILIDIGHPAHVHLFRHFITIMEDHGHQILVTARDKDVTRALLQAYEIPFIPVGKQRPGALNLAREWVSRALRLTRIGRSFAPDLVIGVANPASAFAARILHARSVTLTDTENATLAHSLTFPLTHTILTPACYLHDLGRKQVRYHGYHELAYLHPRYFTPDPSVLDEAGLGKGDRFTIMRFVSWMASHDIGYHGLSNDTRMRAVEELSRFGHVLITSERELPKKFREYQITLPPEKMHHLLAYADLLYGESATMASECAVLGTHAIFSDYTGRGYTTEEETKYQLVYNFRLDSRSQAQSIEKAVSLLSDPLLRETGQIRRTRLLSDTIDVTAYLVSFAETQIFS